MILTSIPKTRDEAMQQKKDKGWSIGEIRAYYNARIGTVNVCWSLEAVLLCIDSCVLLFFPWRGHGSSTGASISERLKLSFQAQQ